MRICSASLTSSRERSVNLRDAPMVRTAAQIMRTIAVGGIHWSANFAPLQRSYYTNG
jgi:hypothetical protein